LSSQFNGRIVCLLGLFSLIFITPGRGQVSPSFTQFYVNPYHFNPSYAGIEGRPTLFLYHRQQWVGIEGAPVTTNLSFHAPLKLGVSAGLDVYNDSRGLLKTNSGLVTIGYTVPFSRTKFLRFGISVGAGFRNIDLSDPSINTSDPAVKNMLDKSAFMNGNFGMSFQSGYFNIGASIPNLFEPNINSMTSFETGTFSPFNELLFNISHRIYFSGDNLAFEPQLLYRYNKSQPSQFEGAGILHIKNLVWLGGSYRQDYGISALGGVKIKNFLSFGYSYGIGSQSLPGIGSSTHEFLLTLFTGKPKKVKKKEQRMVLSFINAEKYVPPKEEKKPVVATTKQEPKKEPVKQEPVKQEAKTEPKPDQAKQALAATETAKQAEKPKNEEITPFFEEKKPETVNQELPKKQEVKPEPRKAVGVDTDQKIILTQEVTKKSEVKPDSQVIPKKIITQVVKKDSVKKELPAKQTEIKTEIKPEIKPEIRHEFIQMGVTSEDLQPGSYIIVGVFNINENADKMIGQSGKAGIDLKKGFVSERGYWYVYAMKGENVGELRDHLDEVREKTQVKDAWLLTIYQKGSGETNQKETQGAVQNKEASHIDSMAAIGNESGVKLEVVSKGNDQFELLKGNYIIVGVLSTFEAAEKYSDRMFRIGQKVRWGYISEKKYWYAYVFYDTATGSIREQLNKIRKVPQFKDAWLLKVQ
jgi:type IX secretion system PorP/SprF family membrane protein